MLRLIAFHIPNHPEIPIEWEVVGTIFRIVLVVCSALFGYWGYRLFQSGIYDKQGELHASYKGFKLAVRQFAPGLGFALIAVTFSLCAVFRPISVEIRTSEYDKTAPMAGDAPKSDRPSMEVESIEDVPESNKKTKANSKNCPTEIQPGMTVPSGCGVYKKEQ